jgi:hypothetical protein
MNYSHFLINIASKCRYADTETVYFGMGMVTQAYKPVIRRRRWEDHGPGQL